MGPHWYYDLEEQGWIIQLMAEFLIENVEYDETLFCEMIDEKVLPHLDGTQMGGKGGYTSQVMRH